MGLSDLLESHGHKVFGPCKNAAILEGSKAFSKDFMKRHHIPTANYANVDNYDDAVEQLKNFSYPVVIKADGLAAGKGVVICEKEEEALQTLYDFLKGGALSGAGKTVVLEEFLTGFECSLLCFTDSKTIIPMVSAKDHKQIFDGNMGPNTGGMGTVAPNPYYTKAIADECMETIFLPTINAMNAEGRTFKGCLYFGLMLTPNGPKVIEYNCRFGDPETQVVLPLLESDLLTVMMATTNGTLADTEVKFADKHACCVILASNGYPTAYKKGFEMTFTEEAQKATYVAGAKLENGKLVTSGGRVTGTTAIADSLADAIKEAYRLSDGVKFEGAYRRSDIGKRALEALN